MDRYTKENRDWWDELAPVHARSAFYDLDGFKAGGSSLMPLEVAELGDVSGRSLLHLQCHFGLDTLSWARRGARVTGVDFSSQGIELARSLARELDIPARFVCADVYDLPDVLDETFDIVFTSYGVLCWLPDLPRWGEVVAGLVKPGGTFYIVELHPFAMVFGSEEGATSLQIDYSYFHSPQPLSLEEQGSYADRSARLSQTVTHEWAHSMGDLINVLVDAGLRINFLHEFPYCMYPMFPFMERGADGWWRLPGQHKALPLLFSLKATRPQR